jgi:pyridoxamine 5'-phosphate oxidase
MDTLLQELAGLRREYRSRPLLENEVAADPIAQFAVWFREAVQSEQPDPEAMTLATAAPDGRIAARIVLLKGCDDRGFTFFTNYRSRKSDELASTEQAALTFYWAALHRQVRIEGRVARTPVEESEAYFQTRPRGSQLGAWASPQSEPLRARDELEARLLEIEARFGDGPISCPPFWGGFRLRPDRIEFWQGRENRLHDRILYTWCDDGWRISRLAP